MRPGKYMLSLGPAPHDRARAGASPCPPPHATRQPDREPIDPRAPVNYSTGQCGTGTALPRGPTARAGRDRSRRRASPGRPRKRPRSRPLHQAARDAFSAGRLRSPTPTGVAGAAALHGCVPALSVGPSADHARASQSRGRGPGPCSARRPCARGRGTRGHVAHSHRMNLTGYPRPNGALRTARGRRARARRSHKLGDLRAKAC